MRLYFLLNKIWTQNNTYNWIENYYKFKDDIMG